MGSAVCNQPALGIRVRGAPVLGYGEDSVRIEAPRVSDREDADRIRRFMAPPRPLYLRHARDMNLPIFTASIKDWAWSWGCRALTGCFVAILEGMRAQTQDVGECHGATKLATTPNLTQPHGRVGAHMQHGVT